MGAGDVVLWPQMRTNSDRRGFLAGIKVDESRNAAFRKFLLHPLLEAADCRHRAIGVEHFLAAQLHGILPKVLLARRTILRARRRFHNPGLGRGLRSRIWPRETGPKSQTSA